MIFPKILESFQPILNQICLFLNVKLAILLRPKRLSYKNSYYIVRVENQKSTQLLIKYLNKYLLLSSKHLDYLGWVKSF